VKGFRRSLGLLAVALLVATGCGGDDSSSDDEATPGTGPEGETPTTEAATPEPVRGGTLVYAVEADTSQPWLPDQMLCAAACYSTVGRTVYEPLVIGGTDGEPHPYLLESFTPNEDSTVWTLVVRQGIKFHDGTDLNADAVAFNLDRTRVSALVAKAVQPITAIQSDGAYTVTVTMSTTWAAFPIYLQSQLGLIGSPTWIQAAVDAQAAGDSSLLTQPVGTGPFVYEDYESGENGRFTATRFEDYWRGDGPNSVTGEGLPYLDRVEVRFMPDSSARSQALLSGDVDLVQTANGVEIHDLRENPDVRLTELTTPWETETGYLLINNAAEVGGAPNPFADLRVRQALAHATNNEVLSEVRAAGEYPVANGPFPPGRQGYLEDSGQLPYDPDAARALVEEITGGSGPLAVTLKTTTDPFNLTTAELLKEMWEEVGFSVTLDQIPQGEFIGQALAGNFQVFTWRNHPGADPDAQWVWWNSQTTTGLALNFGRIVDTEVDRLLEEIRTETDEELRTAAAEELNRYMNEQVFNVWSTWVHWAMATATDVYNAGTLHIPDETGDVTATIGGVVTPIEMFIADG
jgi:peptide/nickel transport system substrate-binding protein